jgi:hypothetical protein
MTVLIINKPRHTEEAHGSVYQAVICSLRRRGYLPLEYPLRAVLNQYQRSGLYNGRLPQNCIEPVKYQVGHQMQFFAMTRFINHLEEMTILLITNY